MKEIIEILFKGHSSTNFSNFSISMSSLIKRIEMLVEGRDPVRYGKFLTRKECREKFSIEKSAMVMGEESQFFRICFSHILTKP